MYNKPPFNEWARYVRDTAINPQRAAHEVSINGLKYVYYSDGAYHAAHLYQCEHGVYPMGATITNLINRKKTILKP
jgi:hypothetical protein